MRCGPHGAISSHGRSARRSWKATTPIVFDPPRAGAFQQAKALAASQVPVIIAVSCNADTFARDAALLCAGGYDLLQVEPVDQFRHTPHVEIVAKFRRRGQKPRRVRRLLG